MKRVKRAGGIYNHSSGLFGLMVVFSLDPSKMSFTKRANIYELSHELLNDLEIEVSDLQNLTKEDDLEIEVLDIQNLAKEDDEVKDYKNA